MPVCVTHHHQKQNPGKHIQEEKDGQIRASKLVFVIERQQNHAVLYHEVLMGPELSV